MKDKRFHPMSRITHEGLKHLLCLLSYSKLVVMKDIIDTYVDEEVEYRITRFRKGILKELKRPGARVQLRPKSGPSSIPEEKLRNTLCKVVRIHRNQPYFASVKCGSYRETFYIFDNSIDQIFVGGEPVLNVRGWRRECLL